MKKLNEIYLTQGYNGIYTIWGEIGKKRYIGYTYKQAIDKYKHEKPDPWDYHLTITELRGEVHGGDNR